MTSVYYSPILPILPYTLGTRSYVGFFASTVAKFTTDRILDSWNFRKFGVQDLGLKSYASGSLNENWNHRKPC